MIIVISKKSRKMLCRDNKFRGFAGFGSYGSCVKVYKNKGSAINKVDIINNSVGWKNLGEVMAIKLERGMSINACGTVIREFLVEDEDEDGVVGEFIRSECVNIKTLEVV